MERLFQRLSPTRILALLLAVALMSPWVLGDYKNAIMLYKRQKYQEALKEIRPDVNKYPDWEFGHRLVGLCYFKLGNYEPAVRAFERAVELKTTEPSVYLGLAEAYYNLGQMDKAATALEQGKPYFKKREDQYNYFRILAHVQYKQNNLAAAADSLLQSFQFQPASVQDLLLLGICYYHSGNDGKARQAFNQVLQQSSGNPEAMGYLRLMKAREGEKALRAKDYRIAQAIFSELLADKPDDPNVQFNLALAKIGLKNWAEAATILRGIEPSFEKSYRYFFYRGYAEEQLGDNQAAEKAYSTALSLQSTDEVKQALKRVRRRLKGSVPGKP